MTLFINISFQSKSSTLEPSHISCLDGKQPDEAPIIPWKNGGILMWDATCVDTFAPSYATLQSKGPGVWQTDLTP